MSGYELRPYRPGDEEAIVRAAALAFEGDEHGFHPRTLEEWRWLYERNPAGRRVWVATHAGEVVAHFAACPHRMRIVGGETVFARVQDPFVHPDHRLGTGRPGLLVELGIRFLEATAGPDADVVGFSWPPEGTGDAGDTREIWSVGEKHFGYEVVRTQGLLRRAPGAGPAELPAGVDVLERFDEQALWLYDRCGGVFGASAVRDEAFLSWRYATHPRHRYPPLGARDDEGILRGLAVVRRGGPFGPDTLVLVDWLVPPEEPAVAERLHAALLALARSEGAADLAGIFPEWSPWFADFQERGWRVHPSDHTTVAIQHHPTYEMHWLRDHWWYQLGDTDLV